MPDLNPSIAKLLKPARYATEMLNVMINNLLDYNLILKNKLSVCKQKTNIREVIDQTVKVMQCQATTRGTRCEVTVQNNVPKTVNIDPDRF